MVAVARLMWLERMVKGRRTGDWMAQIAVAAQTGFSEGWSGQAALAVDPVVDRAAIVLKGKEIAKQD